MQEMSLLIDWLSKEGKRRFIGDLECSALILKSAQSINKINTSRSIDKNNELIIYK